MLWVLALVWGGSVLGQVPSWPVEEEYKLGGKKPGIVGGTVVTADNYPWMCSLRIADDNCGSGISDDHICGGSIIDTTTDSKRWVLTAAHCVHEYGKTSAQTKIDNYNNANSGCDFRLTVDVGRNDPGSSSGSWYTLRMLGWQMHEDWSTTDSTWANDIALAYTYDSLSVTTLLLKIGYPCGNCIRYYQMRALGYGLGNPLEKVVLYHVRWSLCDSAIDAYTTTWDLPVGTICTYKDTTHRISSGDSGGPLVQKVSGRQVGIVSCSFADTSIPQIYTDVTYFGDWITSAKALHSQSILVCHDNCPFVEGYVDDSYCDCAYCEDEHSWTCASCGGCVTNACDGGYANCL